MNKHNRLYFVITDKNAMYIQMQSDLIFADFEAIDEIKRLHPTTITIKRVGGKKANFILKLKRLNPKP